MTPTSILNSTGLRIAPAMSPLVGLAGGTGAFALPHAGEGWGSPATASERTGSTTSRSEETDDADRGADETSAEEVAQSGDSDTDGAADGEGGGQAGAGAPVQPLTIHTLNGLLLTLPATSSPGVRPAPERSGLSAPSGDGSGAQAGGRDPMVAAPGRTGSASAGPHGQTRGDERGGGPSDAPPEPSRGVDRAMHAPESERPARARSAPQAPERHERVAGAAPPRSEGVGGPATIQDARSSSASAVHAGAGRSAAIGDAAAQRKSGAAARPGVPTERTGPAQVVRGVLAAVNQRGGKVTLDLQPGELGRMRVELKLDANTASATFHVDSPEARRLLEDAMPLLRQALTDRGVDLRRAEVVAPSVELPGGLAALQAGAQAVALVALASAQELDARGDGRRPRGDGSREGSAEHEGSGAGGESEDAEGPGRVSVGGVIGPDGVDVLA